MSGTLSQLREELKRHLDIEERLKRQTKEKYENCPICGSDFTDRFKIDIRVEWHDGGTGFTAWMDRHIFRFPKRTICHRNGEHFDISCWTCRSILGTHKP